MTEFKVLGPGKVVFKIGATATKYIRPEDGVKFFDDHPAIANRKGCYVFGIRAGGGITPIYIGVATKTFQQECFESHKLVRYNQALAERKKGTPVLFFIILPKRQGQANRKHMYDLEDFLIQAGVAANKDLLNVKGTKQEEWSIAGVLRSGVGKPSKSASAFKLMMNL